MGSRTRCLGLVLAMMAVNSIYMQTLRQQELIRLLDAEEANIEEIETDPLADSRPELDQIDPRSR
ncbi:MAG: hypothetical protein ACFCU9_04470 [Cyanophyceae cyanobacterium]